MENNSQLDPEQPKATVSGPIIVSPTQSTIPVTVAPEENNVIPIPGSVAPVGNQQNVTDSQPLTPVKSYNSSVTSKSLGHKKLFIGLAIFVVLVIAVVIYFWFLPVQAAKNYQSSIKGSYSNQAAKMTTVYSAFSRPVYNSNNSTTAGDTQDFDFTDQAIKDAQQSNDSLKTQNKLKLFPGANLLHAASTANSHYQAVQKYISDSQTLLTNFQTTSTYMRQFEAVSKNDGQALESLKPIIVAKTLAQFQAASQVAVTQLNKWLSDLNSLQPPVDLKSFHIQLVSGIGLLKSALDNMSRSINAHDLAGVINSSKQLQTAGTSLDSLFATDINTLLQKNSTLHSQIVNLQSAKPLN